MPNPIKAVKAVSKLTTGKTKAIKRAKESNIGVGLIGGKRKLAFTEYNYFGNPVTTKGGKNSKKFAKPNKEIMLSTAGEVGVKAGRIPAAKSRKVSKKTLQKTEATMVPRVRGASWKNKFEVPVKRRGR